MERGEPALTATLHLVRHAAHGLLGQVLTGRMPGVGLSEVGAAQAAALAARFAGIDLAAVWSSPVQRARETAAALGRPVTIEPGLDEVDFGDWTGCRFDALDGRPEWDAWNRARSLPACPGGETMLAAQCRAVDTARRAAQAFPGRHVVLVSHQDVLKAMLAHYLGVSLDRLDRFALDPASTSIVSLSDSAARVEAINLPC